VLALVVLVSVTEVTVVSMGAGTFFKVGSTSASGKNCRKTLWFELATVTPQAGTDLGSAGPLGHLSFWAPRKCGLFSRLCEKRESIPLLCVVPLKIYLLWCRLWFHNCLRSSTEIKTFPTFV